jgi:hypothetical protein
MSEPRDPAASAAPPVSPSFLDKWGPAAAVTLLGLLAIELAILTPLVHYGVDLAPLIGWINHTFGAELSVASGQPGWMLSLGIAWGITRPLKIVQLPAAAALTPVVHRVAFRKDDSV